MSFADIEMKIERLRYLVRMAGTVQAITMGNQLLNPLFPIALYPRYHRDSKSLDTVSEGFSRLMLPGLNQKDQKLPSLHLFFQERYHGGRRDFSKYLHSRSVEPAPFQNISGSTSTGNYVEEEANLLYFEMFTLWLAPLQLELDEELIVRLIRFTQSVRQAYKRSDIGLPSTVRDEILTKQHQGTRSWGILDPKDISSNYQHFLQTDRSSYSSYDIYAKPSRGLYFSLLQLHPLDILVCVRPSPLFHLSTTEMAVISILAQVDSCRIRLHVLIA